MSSGRESDDADPVRIDAPFRGLFAYQFQHLLRVFQRDFGVAVRHPVTQYNGRYALRIKPSGDL